MPKAGETFVTDAGLETELVFHDGIELPEFCSAVLLDEAAGRGRLRRYFTDFVDLARRFSCGVILESSTWRLNRDWAERLGFGSADRRRLNFAAIQLLQDIRHSMPLETGRFVVSGNLGPRYDGYRADHLMKVDDAERYHSEQIQTLVEAKADCVSALTITNTNEAVGIARAAKASGIPVMISFTLETDGSLPSGEDLEAAIDLVDRRVPDAVDYFGINCAHPTHFQHLFAAKPEWAARIGAIRANASTRSHEELDNSSELDEGDPQELATNYHELRELLPALRVFGGCCGTDLRHVTSICQKCIVPAL
jgi:homocysteine S-methyltransferase